MESSSSIAKGLQNRLSAQWYGQVSGVTGRNITVSGLCGIARIGDRLILLRANSSPLLAEMIGVSGSEVVALPYGSHNGVTVGDPALLEKGGDTARPSDHWLGSILDWRGHLPDGSSPMLGVEAFSLDAPAPDAALRRRLGRRLPTRHAALDTFLPLCQGQRIGLFAGSGVGKSMLLSSLARNVEADVCIIALVGERGREVRAFVEDTLDEQARARSVVIATSSDQPALAKRQGARLAMSTAEYFRAQGRHVLLLFDSLTRYAEAHREIALSAGEPPALHAFPPSTSHAMASFVERAGPGIDGEGDITAIFSVLVAGSDMEEPVADMVRGALDGHVILDRAIADRGRYPAINILRSVSRSLPGAATSEENTILQEARGLLADYEKSELIVRAGLYTRGADINTDRAIDLWPAIDRFLTLVGNEAPEDRFAQLRNILRSEAKRA